LNKGHVAFFLKNIVTGAAVSALFFLAASFIPFIGSVIIVFTPLPLLYYFSKFGRGGGGVVFFLSAVLVSIILGFVHTEWHLLVYLAMGLIGISLSEIFRRRSSVEAAVIFPVALILGLFLLFLGYQSHVSGQMPWSLVEKNIGAVIQENIQYYESQGLSQEMIGMIKSDLPKITELFTMIFPAVFLITIALTVIVNVISGKAFLQLRQLPYPDFGDLSAWKAPEKLIWLFILSGICIVVAMLVPAPPWIETAGLNVLIICLFVYLLQGFAIVAYLFKERRVPWFFRYAFYLLVFTIQYLILIVAMVGLFDLWIDFRKLIRKKDKTIDV
jgi:uncharacterized protein YybS (DUF2232 family)